jgi:cellulose synthase/poly-beta-1,6-N-acetylglucosamine synthase-like glycosyltransferase
MTRAVLLVAGATTILGSGWLAALTSYLLGLTIAALLPGRASPPAGPTRRRFALLVPAHDEEASIGRLLASTRALEYPSDRFTVYVVADNCHDRTAEVARAGGACVEERFDQDELGKGYALRWLLGRVRERAEAYDAYVVIDADTMVSPNLLRRLDAHFEAGSHVLQAYYTVLNVGESPLAALRFAALAALHYLRPLGRRRLGLSCGLKGNGMAFAAPVLERVGWSWFTLAEDVELHLALVEAGYRVDFVPEATVLADMPVTFAQAASQNERWERGRLEMLRQRGLGLLLDGVLRRDRIRVDAAVEQLIPPLSVPVVLAGALLGAGLVLRSRPALLLAGFSLLGQIGYVLAGLALARAPWRVYRALTYAPAYIGWKAWLYGQAMVTRGTGRWVRTARGPLPPTPSPATTRGSSEAEGPRAGCGERGSIGA